ncbi:MAG: hypothetical protein ACW96X_00580, partial [Promethearchaeota archaeon]
VVLAKSWLRAPEIKLKTEAYSYENYLQHERAYYFTCKGSDSKNPLEFSINASEEHPIMNLALVIRNIDKGIMLKINGIDVPRGKNFRYGIEHDIDENKVVIWIKLNTIKPTIIKLIPKEVKTSE